MHKSVAILFLSLFVVLFCSTQFIVALEDNTITLDTPRDDLVTPPGEFDHIDLNNMHELRVTAPAICNDKFIPIIRDLINEEFTIATEEIDVKVREIQHLDVKACGVTQQDDGRISIIKVNGVQISTLVNIKYEFGEKNKKPVMKDALTLHVDIPDSTITGYVILVENQNNDPNISSMVIDAEDADKELLTRHGFDSSNSDSVRHFTTSDGQHYIAFVATEIHDLRATTTDTVWAWLYNSALTALNGPLKIALSVLANNHISRVLEKQWNDIATSLAHMNNEAVSSTQNRDAKPSIIDQDDLDASVHPISFQPVIGAEDDSHYTSMEAN